MRIDLHRGGEGLRGAATYADAVTQTSSYAPAPAVYAAPSSVNKNVASALVIEYVPAPDVRAAPAPVNGFVASSPVIEYVAPAPVLVNFLKPPVPVVQVVQVLQALRPQLLIIEKTVETPDFQSAQGTHIAEFLETASVGHVSLAETVEMVEAIPPLHAESAPPVSVTTPVIDVPLVVVELVPPAPVDELVAPAPAVTYAALAPVVESFVPALAFTRAAPAPVAECFAPAPVESFEARIPVEEGIAPVRVVTHTAQDVITFFTARPAVPHAAQALVETRAASSSVNVF